MKNQDLVLIYSIEHGAYWKADSCGYITNRDFAGKYTRAEAKYICEMANKGVPVGCELNEVIEEIDLNPKNYTSDYVSKSELRAWCEKNLINEFYTVSLEDSFAGHHINRVLKVIIEKFCKEEEV